MRKLRLKDLYKKITLSLQLPSPDNYVSLILNEKVRAENVSLEMTDELRSLGSYEETISGNPCWVIPASGDAEMGKLLAKLRDLGFLFVDETGGWPPAAVFRDLRDRGYIDGEFQAVTWQCPGKWWIHKS
jgi:hypothetical protein